MFNSIYKRFHFFNFISSMFSMYSVFQLGIYYSIRTNINFYFAFICLVFGIIFCILGNRYFDDVYQLKENAKKEFTKENKK